jgi:hypothetical protein
MHIPLLMRVDNLEHKNAISWCFQSNLKIFSTKKFILFKTVYSRLKRMNITPSLPNPDFPKNHPHILKQLLCMN